MAFYFLDSSALAKRYLEEAGTERVLQIVDGAERAVVSRLTFVEVASAASRRARGGAISADLLDSVLRVLEDDFRGVFEVVELSGATITRAVDLTRAHALRAADAIQLACALIARGESGSQSGMVLVSSDRELNAAAEHESLEVIDPTNT